MRDDPRSSAAPVAAPAEPAQGTPSTPGVATARTKAQVPPIPTPQNTVPPQRLLGVGLKTDHYDELGYAESAEGLLILELDPLRLPFRTHREICSLVGERRRPCGGGSGTRSPHSQR